MKIGIIAPFYNEEKNLPIFYEEMMKTIQKIGNPDYELLFINDGSKDASLEVALNLQKKDDKIKIIDFSRNFGHDIAIKAGIDHIDGDLNVIIDTDLQDHPSVVVDLYNKIVSENLDMVYVRKIDHWGFLRRTFTNVFYSLIAKLSDIPIPKKVGDFRIMKKSVLHSLQRIQEKSLYMKGLYAWTGFKTGEILYQRPPRTQGESYYSFMRLFSLAFDGIFAFSTVPLRLATILGVIFSILGFILGIYYLIVKLLDPSFYVLGIPTIIVMLSLIGGMILLVLGIMGEYIGRIYKETKNRPLYTIKNIYE
ncbi:MAG: glycosyltransferase family 2 protein [candidate division SR1 bacterium]|nr:glycosyltransferase family 2 protein [candidate division SR1 bacterium]